MVSVLPTHQPEEICPKIPRALLFETVEITLKKEVWVMTESTVYHHSLAVSVSETGVCVSGEIKIESCALNLLKHTASSCIFLLLQVLPLPPSITLPCSSCIVHCQHLLSSESYETVL